MSFSFLRYSCQPSIKQVGLLLLSLVVFLTAAKQVPAKTPYEWTFIQLDYVRRDKVEQLQRFCTRIHEIAVAARSDVALLKGFQINRDYEQMRRATPPPPVMVERISELRAALNAHYIEQYLAFYNILLVNLNGEVVYAIRSSADATRNLITDVPAEDHLAKCLQTLPATESFVDFYPYGANGEPAAFFVEPIQIDGELQGWIVLHCAINKINSLFAWNEDLGPTGETFLVNDQGYMLSESNFEGTSTILKKRLDDRNIQRKFTERVGNRIVKDYRDQEALTSFEAVEFLTARWLVVAKLDKDQIVTDYYTLHHRYCADSIVSSLRQMPPVSRETKGAVPAFAPGVRVDMDEYLKAGVQDCLQTFGISTCTGILAIYPDKFAYMAHVSPNDKIYGQTGANLLGQMIKRIRSFDLYPCEERQMQFVIVAPHYDTLERVIDKLVEEKFLLSQIKVLINPQANSASMAYDYSSGNLTVYWRYETAVSGYAAHGMSDAIAVNKIAETIMRIDEKPIFSGNHTQRVESARQTSNL